MKTRKVKIEKTMDSFEAGLHTYYLDKFEDGLYAISKDEFVFDSGMHFDHAKTKFNALQKKHSVEGPAKGDKITYLGYTIKNCTNNDGIVLLSPDGSHYGNFGDDLMLAKKYALLYYMCTKPKLRLTVVSRLAESTKGGRWGDYNLLTDCLHDDDLLPVPDEIKMTDGMNHSIDFHKGFV